MIYCIPSKNRPNFSTEHIVSNPVIFVEPQDYDSYKSVNPDRKLVNICKDNQGISYVRNYILNYARKQHSYCGAMVDDDIINITDHTKKPVKLITLNELGSNISKLFTKNIAMLSVPYTFHQWYAKDINVLKNNMKALNLIFFNMAVLPNTINYDSNANGLEDIEIIAQILTSGLEVKGCFKYSFRNNACNTEGGFGNIDRKKLCEKSIAYINNKYGVEFMSLYPNSDTQVKVQFNKLIKSNSLSRLF